jgi:hypothetical protein
VLVSMKTIENYQKANAYCPWNNMYGLCVSCMAMIEIHPIKFICGRLYPPEHFDESSKLI